MEPTTAQADRDDVATIHLHVQSLFDAFIAGDRAALKEGRLEDWAGFQISSSRLINGVGSYMEELEAVLGDLQVARYEFLDFEIKVLNDVALVLYVARDWLIPGNGRPPTILIRALDVYRKMEGRWIQAASNINSMPDNRS